MNRHSPLSTLPPEAFIRLPDVLELVGLKRSTIYELIQHGKFPAPHKLTLRASAWRVGEVREWLASPVNWPHPGMAIDENADE